MTPEERADELITLLARSRGYNHGKPCADLWDDPATGQAVAAAIREAAAAEREACALAAERAFDTEPGTSSAHDQFRRQAMGRQAAAAVRARGC